MPVIDFCEVIMRLCESKFKVKENNIINLGSEKSISLLDSAKLINEIYYKIYKKEIEIILKGKKELVKDFRICNQFLIDNNLNIKLNGNFQDEIKNLLYKCNEYFMI